MAGWLGKISKSKNETDKVGTRVLFITSYRLNDIPKWEPFGGSGTHLFGQMFDLLAQSLHRIINVALRTRQNNETRRSKFTTVTCQPAKLALMTSMTTKRAQLGIAAYLVDSPPQIFSTKPLKFGVRVKELP